MNCLFDKTFSKSLPIELVIEIFEKISLKEKEAFIKLSKINKQFYFVYKKYFEEKIKKEYYKVDFGKEVKVQIPRNGDLLYSYYLNYPIGINDNINTGNYDSDSESEDDDNRY